MWNVAIEPIDSPPIATITPDLDAAVTRALDRRADLTRAKKDIDNAQVAVKYADNQKLPDVRFNLSYTANGLGGTQILRDTTAGFPALVVGPGSITSFGSVLNQLFAQRLSDVDGRRQRHLPARPERRGGRGRARAGSSVSRRTSGSRAARRRRFSRCATPAGRST